MENFRIGADKKYNKYGDIERCRLRRYQSGEQIAGVLDMIGIGVIVRAMQRTKEREAKTKRRGYVGPKLRGYSIYVREDLIKKIDKRAAEEGVNRSMEIEQLLREILALIEKGDVKREDQPDTCS